MTREQLEEQLRQHLRVMTCAVLDRAWAIAIGEAARFIATCATQMDFEDRALRTAPPHRHAWSEVDRQFTAGATWWKCACGARAFGQEKPEP